jgi:hypothetical protein
LPDVPPDPTPTPTPDPTPTLINYIVVTKTNLNVRTTPSTKIAALGVLKPGAKFRSDGVPVPATPEQTATDKTWIWVKLYDVMIDGKSDPTLRGGFVAIAKKDGSYVNAKIDTNLSAG